MMRIVLLLALAPLVQADSTQQASTQLDSDKMHIQAKIKSLEKSAEGFQLTERDESQIKGFASTAQKEAADTFHTRRENALNAYKTSLANLQALPPTANKTDAENKVKQDKNEVDRLQEDEDNYAKKKLSQMQHSRKEAVIGTLNDAKNTVRQMKKNRNQLEDARRNEGWSEQRYEREEMNNEKWAEDAQLLAERQKDNATDIVDRTFGRAEGYLENLQAQARQERAADMDQKTSSSVWAIQDLVVSPASFAPSIGLCLLAIASVGLTRAMSAWSLRTRATPAALPLLG